ncbi:MAG: DUF7694 domain-containing protein [Terriglobia bacterium]
MSTFLRWLRSSLRAPFQALVKSMRPLLPAESVPPKWEGWAASVMRITGISDMKELRRLYETEFLCGDTFMNDLYVVIRTEFAQFTHLSIRRTDRGAAKDWRHFQAIKNQLCGKEREAVELYPAESRLVDTANQFHLWVFAEGVRLPIGYDQGRHVSDPATTALIPGAVQREFEKEGEEVKKNAKR